MNLVGRRAILRPGRSAQRGGFGFREPTRSIIPDLTFVAHGREGILAADGIRGEGPDAVIAVRSPGDESYDKLPFFARLGVREVIVVSRDTKAPEVFRLSGSQYLALAADRDGWVVSDVLGVRFAPAAAQEPRLVIEDLEDPSCRTEI